MTPQPLNYRSPDAHSPRRPWMWRVGVAIVVLLGVLSVPGIVVREVQSRIDAVTATMSFKTVWFGITSGPRVNVSPLEQRLKSSGIPWTPDWRTLHNTHRNLFGRAIMYECSSAPPIHTLRPLLADFAAASTDEELREFVRVMQSGTEQEQNAAVDAAAEKGLKAMAARP